MIGFNEWLEIYAPATKQTRTHNTQVADRKRKRIRDIIQQVFFNEEVVVDGMGRNLAPLLCVTTRNHRQVLEYPEPVILFFNGNTNLRSERISEYGLATSVQLLRIHNIIVQESGNAKQVVVELMLVIKSRHDHFEAKDIVEKNLDNYDL
ncbi:hypothetical protein Tco_0636039 [Tanacetum coccineum]